MDEENVTGAVTDNADTGMFAALVGKQMAEDVLGTQAFQDGSGSVVFIADNGGSAFADDADFMKAFIVIAYGPSRQESSFLYSSMEMSLNRFF